MESRYLLILTENLSVLSIILDEFAEHNREPEVVFGSKFKDDVSYTQVSNCNLCACFMKFGCSTTKIYALETLFERKQGRLTSYHILMFLER